MVYVCLFIMRCAFNEIVYNASTINALNIIYLLLVHDNIAIDQHIKEHTYMYL